MQHKEIKMKRFMLTATALVLGLAFAGQADAAPKGPSGKGGSGSFKNYHQSHGHKFEHGYYYRGHQHYHWQHRYYNSRYGCWTYYDPCVRNYYYWCQPASCYYPVSYCPYGRYCWDTAPICTSCVVVQQPIVVSATVTTVVPVDYTYTVRRYQTVTTQVPVQVAAPCTTPCQPGVAPQGPVGPVGPQGPIGAPGQ